MRDPREVIKGRIDARINRQIHEAKVKARQKAEGQARKVVAAAGDKAKKKQGRADEAPAAKKKKMGWWKFGDKEGEAGAASGCPGCGAETDPSWKQCPYCGNDLAADAPAPAGQPPLPQGGPARGPGPELPAMASNRTMAVDISALKATKKEVVGWIVIMNGNQKGTDDRLYPGKNTMGAAADNDIVITDEFLSSRHAMIRYEDGRYELLDAESTNGCFVNDKKVTKEELIDNDSIRLGRTEFRFKALY